MVRRGVLHVLQLAVRVDAGGRVLRVRHPQVHLPAHHDHERHGHVLLAGKPHRFLERSFSVNYFGYNDLLSHNSFVFEKLFFFN